MTVHTFSSRAELDKWLQSKDKELDTIWCGGLTTTPKWQERYRQIKKSISKTLERNQHLL
jgi:hypothetical protein